MPCGSSSPAHASWYLHVQDLWPQQLSRLGSQKTERMTVFFFQCYVFCVPGGLKNTVMCCRKEGVVLGPERNRCGSVSSQGLPRVHLTPKEVGKIFRQGSSSISRFSEPWSFQAGPNAPAPRAVKVFISMYTITWLILYSKTPNP